MTRGRLKDEEKMANILKDDEKMTKRLKDFLKTTKRFIKGEEKMTRRRLSMTRR